MAYQTSQGLASLGRNGDSVLVHMSPTEVAGLQGLAMSQGGSLTINPHTGLPEAFKLGGFFKSLLPTIAGGLVSMIPGMQPFGLSAMQAGILAGAATGALTNKDNPLMGAALGGLGGYGGVGIGSALKNTMAITSPAAAASSAGQAAVSGIGPGAVGTTGQIGGANLIGSGVAGGTAASNAAAQNIMGAMNNAGMNIADPIIQDATKNALQTLPRTSNFSGINMDPTSSFLKSTPFDQAYGASTIQPSGTMGGSTLIGEGRNLANSAASAQNPLIAGAMSNSPTPGFMDTFVDQLGGTRGAVKQLGLPLGGAVLGGLEPSDLYGEPINMDDAKRKQKYDPYATLNLSGDTGLRLYAEGGTIATGGIRDLYGSSDNQNQAPLSRDGYGLGRLNQLGNQQSLSQAQTLGYAEGGDVSNYKEDQAGLNVNQLPSLNLNFVNKPSEDKSSGSYPGYSGPDSMVPAYLNQGTNNYVGSVIRNISEQGPGNYIGSTFRRIGEIGPGNYMGEIFRALSGFKKREPTSYALNLNSGKQEAQYAMGGPVSFADGGDSNKEDALGLPSLSPDMSMDPNAGDDNSAMIQSVMGAMQPMQGMQGSTTAQGQMLDQNNDSLIAKVTANLKVDPNYQPENPIEAAIVKQIKGTDPMQQGQPSLQGLGSLGPSQPMAPSYNPSQSTAPSFNPSVAMGPTYFAGINAPQGYARGGYLDGQGDGMSDSIPATIEGKQPARLADGEFVVPADVVSHLGNGSSKAGSKRLYAMLDKVRRARTGNKKQGKQIKPEKYMPA